MTTSSTPQDSDPTPQDQDEPVHAPPVENAPDSPQTSESVKPAGRKRWLRWLIIAAVVYFVYALIADRLTPSSSQARVRGYIALITPQVSGPVVEVAVSQNQFVKRGDLLVQLDKRPFELAQQQAEAALQQAGQDIGAGTAGITAARNALTDAEVHLQYQKVLLGRAQQLDQRGAIAKDQLDQAQTAFDSAAAKVALAQAQLDQTTKTLGPQGEENPRIQQALTALERARLDLLYTSIRAPVDGVVTNVRFNAGHYAQAGKQLMTFFATKGVWIEASFRENCLENIAPGDAVDFCFDSAPGRVWRGHVQDTAIAVRAGNPGAIGDLSSAEPRQGWLREPQRFPVYIEFPTEEVGRFCREGGQVDLVIYTKSSFFPFGTLAWIDIRLRALASYLW